MTHNRHLMRASVLAAIGLLGVTLYLAMAGTETTVSLGEVEAVEVQPPADRAIDAARAAHRPDR